MELVVVVWCAPDITRLSGQTLPGEVHAIFHSKLISKHSDFNFILIPGEDILSTDRLEGRVWR